MHITVPVVRKLLLAQLVLGAGVVASKSPSQSSGPTFPRDSALIMTSSKPNTEPPVENADGARRDQRVEDTLASIDKRLAMLEGLRISDRLAVLENIADREWRVEMLEYGVIATLGGNLVLSILNGMKKERRGR